jgi:aminopeptidase N
MEVIDPEAIHLARRQFMRDIASQLPHALRGGVPPLHDAGRVLPGRDIGGPARAAQHRARLREHHRRRHLRALAFLEFRRAENMTDAMAALVCLSNCAGAERDARLAMFYDKWKGEALVVDKWFSVQATSILPGRWTA